LTTTVAADELTNLAHERGVCYAFVDGDGEVLDPQEVGDGNQELTDRMSRTGGATAQHAFRVRFDFTTSITPRAVIIDRQWKANELGVGLDGARILVGNSPDSLAEVLTEEAIGADYARESGVYAPSALLTVLDASLPQEDAHIHVASGIGLDPRQGKSVTYGPSDGPR